MRKRKSLLFILILGVILLVTLAACNPGKVDPGTLPPNLGGDTTTDGGDDTPTDQTVRLEFTFPIAPSSVFSGIFVEEFDIERYVEYSVVYYDGEGAVIKKIPRGGVKTDMVAEEDKPYLSVAGHHNIHVTASLDDNTEVKGSFALHLKDKSGVISLVDFSFDLDSGHGIANAYFGSVANHKVTVSVEKGAVITDWNEFLNTFKMSLPDYALDSVTATSGGKQIILAEGTGFPFTIDGSLDFSTAWTGDIINITYNLNAPDSRPTTGSEDPKPLFASGGKYASEPYTSAKRGTGHAMKPDENDFNVYDGYFFAGWVNEATGLIYTFSSFVGNENIRLKAKWVAADYSFTIYTMGGEFASDITSSTVTKNNNTVELTVDNAKEYGYTLIECTSRFGLSDGKLNRVTFTGFHYGIDYKDYAAEVTVSPSGRKVVLKFEDIYSHSETSPNVFQKGDGSYLAMDDLYSDYQCTEGLVRHDKVSTEQPVTYIKWVFNESADGEENLNRISKWYTENIFKDGYTIKADGSVRIDKVADYSVNELIIPAAIKIDGVTCAITEIGDRACSNIRALTKVDMSKAKNLTKLGTNAFAYDDYLKDIIMPVENSIVEMGENAFLDTDYENNYKKNTGGAEFIVINKMIYKYVGEDDPTDPTVDLSDPSGYYTQENAPDMSKDMRARLNDQLSKVEIIVDGAFAKFPSLQTLKLPVGIKELQNNAFYGLADFVELTIPAGSALTVIGETAFDGSGMLTENSKLYDPTSGAIIIGEVYYRLLDRNATSVDIPETHKGFTIKYIAPRAFDRCTQLNEVNIAKPGNILAIGKDAFLDTKYIQTQTGGYTVVNGILTAYYGPTYDANKINLVIPDKVVTLATNAFSNYARYFETIQINSNVKMIENNAFNGAYMLKSMIFPDVRKGYKRVDNLPDIADDAFANSNGVMIGATYYFDEEVIKYFADLDAGTETTTDTITLKWLNLYRMHKSSFETEKINYVQIDESVVANVLLRTGKYEADNPGEKGNAFLDKYGKKELLGALKIMPNTLIPREASLSWDNNDMSLVEVTVDGDYKQYYVPGLLRYVIKYTYNGSSEGCDVYPFVVTVYNAIKDAPTFNSSDNYDEDATSVISLDGLNSENSNFWISGLENQVKDARYPTFYTSFNAGKVQFVYKDRDWKQPGDEKTIDIDITRDMEHFSTREVTSLSEAIITVNFHGIGKYKLSMSYAVVMSKFETIRQNGAVVIPVNGNAEEYLRNYTVDMVGQDGNIVKYTISSARFVIRGNDGTTNIDTSKLGMNTLKLRYNGSDADGELALDLNYTVVATADESLFGYGIVNESRKLAKIISYTGRSDSVTVVIPSKTTRVPGHIGEEFTVVQIGDSTARGVFQNMSLLTNVYLPETIDTIGVNTFAGCSLLSGVYTARQMNVEPVKINLDGNEETYFESVGAPTTKDGITVKNVILKSLENLEYGETLVIGGEYRWGRTKYVIVGLAKDIAVKQGCKNVYLPDTVYVRSDIFVANENGEKTDTTILPSYYSNDDRITVQLAEAPVQINLTAENVGTYFTNKGEPYKQDEVTIQNVILKSLKDVEYGETLVIGREYELVKDGNKTVYVIVGLAADFKVKEGCKNVYLPDSMYREGGILVESKAEEGGAAADGEQTAVTITPQFYSGFARITEGEEAGKYLYEMTGSVMTGIDAHITENLTFIAQGAFMGCSSLKSVDLSLATGLTDIGALAFSGSGLGSIDLSKNTLIKSISSQTFMNCAELKEVAFSSQLEIIGVGAFDGCVNLGKVSYINSLGEVSGYGRNLKRIYDNAFNRCTSLTSFEIYSSIENVGANVFSSCNALTIYCRIADPSVADNWHPSWNDSDCPVVWNYDSNREADDGYVYVVVDGIRYALNVGTLQATVVRQAYSLSGNIVIPASINAEVKIGNVFETKTFKVVAIGEYAFEGNTKIESVKVSSELKTIEQFAFLNCSELTSFVCEPESGLVNVAISAFDGCDKLLNKPIAESATE